MMLLEKIFARNAIGERPGQRIVLGLLIVHWICRSLRGSSG